MTAASPGAPPSDAAAGLTEVIDGRMVIVRRAREPDGMRALEHQAAVLTAAAGRGVVELLGLHRDGDDLVLVAAAVDGPPLAGAGLSPAEVAGTVAGLARALAALHLAGLVHGAVALDNVRVRRSDGEAVLGLPGGPDGPRSPADDVAGLGAILLALAGDDGDRMSRLRRRATTGNAAEAAAVLRSVGAWAADPDPTRRPTSEAVAAALERAAPARPVRGLSLPARRPAPKTPTRRRALVAAALASGLLAAAVAAVALAGRPRPSPAPDRAARPPTPAATEQPSPCPEPDTGPAADVDGDGCPEALAVEGGEIVAGSLRFAAGRPGDVVVVGDWDCDGQATPAVLDPATGDLFVFDAWPPSAGGELTVGARAAVAGAIGARTADVDGDGCDDVVLERRSGPPAVVRPAGGKPHARSSAP